MYRLIIKHSKTISQGVLGLLSLAVFSMFLSKLFLMDFHVGQPGLKREFKDIRLSSKKSTDEPKVKLILLYTLFFGEHWKDHPALGPLRPPMIPGRVAFDDCEYKCELTYNRDSLAFADAVGFHGPDLRHTPSDLPNRTRKDQIWFYYVLENPLNCNITSSFSGVFNWTMSYRHGSEIYVPYGKYALLDAHDVIKEVDLSYKDLLVAWMASNCRGMDRNTYVAMLQKYIPVDVYGFCGRFKCRRRSTSCRLLLKRYKFYLAFENGNCREYVTEKYWDNALGNDVVPIVMGGANYSNPAMAIPNSYIDVRDFSSPKELALYLIYLNKNDTAYMEYFRWKTKYKIVPPKRACSMCTALHNKELYDPPRSVADLRQTWSTADCHSSNLVNRTIT